MSLIEDATYNNAKINLATTLETLNLHWMCDLIFFEQSTHFGLTGYENGFLVV